MTPYEQVPPEESRSELTACFFAMFSVSLLMVVQAVASVLKIYKNIRIARSNQGLFRTPHLRRLPSFVFDRFAKSLNFLRIFPFYFNPLFEELFDLAAEDLALADSEVNGLKTILHRTKGVNARDYLEQRQDQPKGRQKSPFLEIMGKVATKILWEILSYDCDVKRTREIRNNSRR